MKICKFILPPKFNKEKLIFLVLLKEFAPGLSNQDLFLDEKVSNLVKEIVAPLNHC